MSLFIGPQRKLSSSYCSILTFANAFGPTDDQVASLSDWTISEVRKIFSVSFFPRRGIPTRLFVAIEKITRLRVLAAKNESFERVLRPTARAICDDIESFAPSQWGETYHLPDTEYTLLLGELWKTTVTLYGFLSLPPTVGTYLSSCDEAHTSPFEERKGLYCKKLLQEIDCMMQRPGYNRYICVWPLAVLGAGLVNGQHQERARVLSHLQVIWRDPSSFSGAILAYSKLKRFWSSGRTAWDDCFDEPCLLL